MSVEVSANTCHQTVDNQAHGGSGENVNTASSSSDITPKQDTNSTNSTKLQETKVEKDDVKNITFSEKKETDSSDPKNDSSTLSTAFTISFDDDNNDNNSNKKLFGIRDSIRKFAPPKPNTIEKPRPSKNDSSGPDNSYMSIESAPGGYPKNSPSTFRRGANYNSCRSSGRRSDSRHSNISESAAFLIDRMLNTKHGESLSSIYLDSDNKARSNTKLTRGQTVTIGNSSSPKKQLITQLSGEDDLDDEIDYCEDRSDNGTYIVGTDPESEAARKRIDELFGVVKAAEASLKANASSNIAKQKQKPPLATNHSSRPSRAADKKPGGRQMSRERQEHIARLATGRHSSRSSSSSRQELSAIGSGGHRPRSATRQQQCNSLCDQTNSKLPIAQKHHRRAASQSSRQSSNRDPSEADDTRSSRSSLHTQNLPEVFCRQENQQSSLTNTSMKFNRAFALRRARLGLGEPLRTASGLQNNGLPSESDGQVSSLASPKRSAAAGKYNQIPTSSTATPQNLSRTDGGRFSLRMRNNVASRLTSGYRTNQQHLGATIIDNYMGKVSAGSSKLSAVTKSSSSTMPYPSGDELDAALLSPSRSRQTISRLAAAAAANAPASSTKMQNLLERRDIAPEWEMIDSDTRLNYSLGLDQVDSSLYNEKYNNRICQSAGRQGSSSALTSSQQQQQQPPLGALDCLVISAISGLSMKIRGSVCDLMVEHAKRLPKENETRLIVEEILPQLTANSSRPKSPTSIEDIDQSVYFDLAQTLKNLKKLEQMVDVMKMISNQIPTSSCSPTNNNIENSSNTTSKSSSTSLSGGLQATGSGVVGGAAETVSKTTGACESNTNSEVTSLSPV